MHGMYMAGTNCTWLVDGCCSGTCILVSWSELASFSNLAEFLVVLVILEILTLDLRPHPSKYKNSTYLYKLGISL